jgi:hypothetical protein
MTNGSVTYGENVRRSSEMPDLRGFVDAQHAAERRVLLCSKPGILRACPQKHCITNAAGLPHRPGPHPSRLRPALRNSIHRMLSPEGYDADGSKLTLLRAFHVVQESMFHGELWGLELSAHIWRYSITKPQTGKTGCANYYSPRRISLSGRCGGYDSPQ